MINPVKSFLTHGPQNVSLAVKEWLSTKLKNFTRISINNCQKNLRLKIIATKHINHITVIIKAYRIRANMRDWERSRDEPYLTLTTI